MMTGQSHLKDYMIERIVKLPYIKFKYNEDDLRIYHVIYDSGGKAIIEIQKMEPEYKRLGDSMYITRDVYKECRSNPYMFGILKRGFNEKFNLNIKRISESTYDRTVDEILDIFYILYKSELD